MTPKLFDLVGGEIKPTEHCYTINSLRNVIDEYGDNAGKVFATIHYYLSLNPEDNPFAYLPEVGRWDQIIASICPELDLNNPIVEFAIEDARKAYETTLYKVFKSFKNLLDKLSVAIGDVNPNLSKDLGNMGQIKEAVKSYKELKAAYNDSFEEYMRSFDTVSGRGGTKTAYDADFDDDLD